jgi:hypothetical protein
MAWDVDNLRERSQGGRRKEDGTLMADIFYLLYRYSNQPTNQPTNQPANQTTSPLRCKQQRYDPALSLKWSSSGQHECLVNPGPSMANRTRMPFDEKTDTRGWVVALIGYARVSTGDQKLALQHDALNAAGCERIFDDHASGAKTDRPGLTEALAYLRVGDTPVVWKLDRLGRSMSQLIEKVGELAARGGGFRSVTEQNRHHDVG